VTVGCAGWLVRQLNRGKRISSIMLDGWRRCYDCVDDLLSCYQNLNYNTVFECLLLLRSFGLTCVSFVPATRPRCHTVHDFIGHSAGLPSGKRMVNFPPVTIPTRPSCKPWICLHTILHTCIHAHMQTSNIHTSTDPHRVHSRRLTAPSPPIASGVRATAAAAAASNRCHRVVGRRC